MPIYEDRTSSCDANHRKDHSIDLKGVDKLGTGKSKTANSLTYSLKTPSLASSRTTSLLGRNQPERSIRFIQSILSEPIICS